DGTLEVLPSVCSSIATTILAFIPLMFVTGVMGKFIAVMPVTIIAVLLASLFESALVLPCHLAHEGSRGGLVGIAERFRLRLTPMGRMTIGAALLAFAHALTALSYPFRKLQGLFVWLNG